MIFVVRRFLIVQLIRHFSFHLCFNLRLVYLPSDVLHVHKKKYKLNHGHRGYSWELEMVMYAEAGRGSLSVAALATRRRMRGIPISLDKRSAHVMVLLDTFGSTVLDNGHNRWHETTPTQWDYSFCLAHDDAQFWSVPSRECLLLRLPVA